MADTYLPADVRTRINDLIKNRKTTQKKVAIAIGISESTLSRFLKGEVEKLGEESIIRLARVFDVSTDFILGVTEIPDKKHYDISELGLSVEAAKNLYTGKVNTDVVKRLLENPRFAMVTYMIGQYLDDTFASGFAAQNQMLTSLSSMMLGQNKTPAAVMAAREANAQRVPVQQYDLARIQDTFMTAVKEVKREVGSDLEAAKALSKEATEEMFATLMKGQNTPVPSATPEEIAGLVTQSISNVEGVDQQALDTFNQALVCLMKTMVLHDEPGK